MAGVAAFSPHHFHRQFTALLGVPPGRYVQLVRLKRATWRLAFRDAPVLEVALDSGYQGPEAFTRAFRQQTGQSPSAFRRQPDWAAWQAGYRPVSDIRRNFMTDAFAPVRVIDAPDIPVAVLEHRGDPATLGDSVRSFIQWRRAAGLAPRLSATYNIFHDDPDQTDPADFRLDICAAAARVPANDLGVRAGIIPGGRCAVLRHVGTDEGFGAAIRHLYADWLPSSGQDLRDFPLYCQRVAFFPDVPEHEAITDIFLPLK
nr:AraC family transcriptional regulator [Nitrospirillum iridis]